MSEASEKASIQILLGRLFALNPDVGITVKVYSDRPDATFELNGEEIGVEVTCAVFQEYARGIKIHMEDFPHAAVTDVQRPDRNGRNRSREEITADLLDLSQWKPFHEVLNDWGTKIFLSVNTKRKKLNREGFRIFPTNWLLIDDQPGIVTAFEFSAYSQILMRVFMSRPVVSIDFDTIFIISGDHLFRLEKNNLYAGSFYWGEVPAEQHICTYTLASPAASD